MAAPCCSNLFPAHVPPGIASRAFMEAFRNFARPIPPISAHEVVNQALNLCVLQHGDIGIREIGNAIDQTSGGNLIDVQVWVQHFSETRQRGLAFERPPAT